MLGAKFGAPLNTVLVLHTVAIPIFCYICYLLAAHAPADRVAGRVFNVATGTRVDLNETFQALKKLTGYSGEVKHGPEREGDIKHSLADISRAEKAFGYKAIVNFEEGLKRTVDWYRGQGKRAIA